MKEQLLKIAYENKHKYISEMEELGENGHRLFDCLIELIEDGNIIETESELKEYMTF